VEKDIERDLWLNAEEAKKYGLIDKVLKSKKTLKKK
jgi:ATP-dependent protease ClpP protease subunit